MKINDAPETDEIVITKKQKITVTIMLALTAAFFVATFFAATNFEKLISPDKSALAYPKYVWLMFSMLFLLTLVIHGAIIALYAIFIPLSKNPNKFYKRTKGAFGFTLAYAPIFLIGQIGIIMLSINVTPLLILTILCCVMFWVNFGYQNSLNKRLTKMFNPSKKHRHSK